MKFGIKLNGDFLDLFPGAVVSFQFNNLIFSGNNNEILPGAYSVPVTVPLTAKNKQLLQSPHLHENADEMLRDVTCEIVVGGATWHEALLTVRSASEFEARIYTVINPFKNLKLKKLRDAADEERTGITPAHAKDTAQNPLNHDYIFFPVLNRDALDDSPFRADFANKYQNYYDPAAGAFGESEDYPIAMPFVRVDYLLDKIFEDSEFSFVNRWQIDDALRKIVLYSNYSIYVDTNADEKPDRWSSTINLKNHVPDITAADFLKGWMRIFALGLFFDSFSRKAELVPIRNLLLRAAKHDWSDKLLRGSTIDRQKDNVPENVQFEIPSEDEYFTVIEDHFTGIPEPFFEVDDFPQMNAIIGNPGFGYFYVRRKAQYYAFTLNGINTELRLIHCDLGEEPERDKDYEYISRPAPLIDYFFGNDSYSPRNFPFVDFPLGPLTVAPCTMQLVTIPGVDQQEAKLPFRWMVYQGMSPDQNGDLYPRATLNESATHGFTYQGENGIFNTYWREWFQMLRYGKTVNVELKLSFSEFNRFNFQDKIRLNNIDYFIKSMKVSFDSSGLLPVKCELISVI